MIASIALLKVLNYLIGRQKNANIFMNAQAVMRL